MSYKEKYLKYKIKYLNIKNLQLGGSSSELELSNKDILRLLFLYQNLFNKLQYNNIDFSNLKDIEEIKTSIFGNNPLDNQKLHNVIVFISSFIEQNIQDHKIIIMQFVNINLKNFIISIIETIRKPNNYSSFNNNIRIIISNFFIDCIIKYYENIIQGETISDNWISDLIQINVDVGGTRNIKQILCSIASTHSIQMQVFENIDGFGIEGESDSGKIILGRGYNKNKTIIIDGYKVEDPYKGTSGDDLTFESNINSKIVSSAGGGSAGGGPARGSSARECPFKFISPVTVLGDTTGMGNGKSAYNLLNTDSDGKHTNVTGEIRCLNVWTREGFSKISKINANYGIDHGGPLQHIEFKQFCELVDGCERRSACYEFICTFVKNQLSYLFKDHTSILQMTYPGSILQESDLESDFANRIKMTQIVGGTHQNFPYTYLVVKSGTNKNDTDINIFYSNENDKNFLNLFFKTDADFNKYITTTDINSLIERLKMSTDIFTQCTLQIPLLEVFKVYSIYILQSNERVPKLFSIDHYLEIIEMIESLNFVTLDENSIKACKVLSLMFRTFWREYKANCVDKMESQTPIGWRTNLGHIIPKILEYVNIEDLIVFMMTNIDFFDLNTRITKRENIYYNLPVWWLILVDKYQYNTGIYNELTELNNWRDIITRYLQILSEDTGYAETTYRANMSDITIPLHANDKILLELRNYQIINKLGEFLGINLYMM
jgi:hypothetical protein